MILLGYPPPSEEIKQREKAYSQQLQREGAGDISGASPDCTPMSVFLMCVMPTSYTRY